MKIRGAGQRRGGRLWVTGAAILVLALMTSCSDELDPTEPEGAYELFTQSLFAGDAEGVWARTDQKTHEQFQEYYETLVEMDETIVRYLPQTDHKIARKQSGTELLAEVKDGRQLFMKVFRPMNLEEMENGQAIRVGSELEEIEVSQDKTQAKVTTKGGDTFFLTRGDRLDPERRDKWFVMLTQSSEAVGKRLGWVPQNEDALDKTIEDLIAEERETRERVIAELMNLKPPAGAEAAPGPPQEDGQATAAAAAPGKE